MYRPFLLILIKNGASGRNRTGTPVKARDFKSRASTNFATEASVTQVERSLYRLKFTLSTIFMKFVISH